MKKFISIIVVLLSFTILTSCEDVINVDLPSSQPRLVVDASIQWQKGTTGNEQKIKLTTTADYFSSTIPVVSNATVFITNENNTIFTFTEIPNSGEYVCDNFIPEINKTYVLTIVYNGETYTATETLKSVPQINSIEQRDDLGFSGDEIGVKIKFQDNANEENQYLFQFNTSAFSIPQFDVLDDRFSQGNEMFALYSDQQLEVGDTIDFKLFGISRTYYNYMNILLGVAGSNNGSPFSTPPATVRGNLINSSNAKNYAFGYFNLSEIDSINYTIQ
jgi:hypothetical protein